MQDTFLVQAKKEIWRNLKPESITSRSLNIDFGIKTNLDSVTLQVSELNLN